MNLRTSSLSAISLLLALLLSGKEIQNVAAFSTPKCTNPLTTRVMQHKHSNNFIDGVKYGNHQRSFFDQILPLKSSSSDSDVSSAVDAAASRSVQTPKLTQEDRNLVKTLYQGCNGNTEAMENNLTANLDNMHPRLVVALQMAAKDGKWEESPENDEDGAAEVDEEFESQMVALGTSLKNVLDVRLRSGRELLADLLKSGEIRKLDSLIGKAAKEGKLDMSFFSVLSMNMKDAVLDDDATGGATTSPVAVEHGADGGGETPPSANRLQILQHIYTRCQEELEKNVAPGMGLLNKLLRTDISSIRTNQLQHYLGPQATTITSPDGKTIDLGGTSKPLVSHGEFIEALSNAVTQIRTIEAAGGTDRLSAANLVENIRQVAMEARVVLVSSFGEDSDVVKEFQRDLQPVFRPGSKVES